MDGAITMYNLVMESLRALDQDGKFRVEEMIRCTIILPRYKTEAFFNSYKKYKRHSIAIEITFDLMPGALKHHMARNRYRMSRMRFLSADEDSVDIYDELGSLTESSLLFRAVMDRIDSANEKLFDTFIEKIIIAARNEELKSYDPE